VVFRILCFTLCPFETKRGSIFCFGPGLHFSPVKCFLSQNGQRGSLLVCDWLHSVGQNHFYVMMLIIQGCCFIQSLHFSYELQEDFVQDSKQRSSIPLHPSGCLSNTPRRLSVFDK
jgi:hypothetical protein